LGGRKVGKFLGAGRGNLRRDPPAIAELVHEFEIAQWLRSFGAPVPRPYGVFNIPLHYTPRATQETLVEFFPAFVMDFCEFPDVDSLPIDSRIIPTKKAKRELERLREAGFTPGRGALSPRNLLWDAENEQVYLIDFLLWAFNH